MSVSILRVNTPDDVEEALNKLNYIRVLMLNCKTTEKIIDYYYNPVKQHIQAQDRHIKKLEEDITKLSDIIVYNEELSSAHIADLIKDLEAKNEY